MWTQSADAPTLLEMQPRKTASCLISGEEVFFRRRLRATFFQMAIKGLNLPQTKGCTLQSGRISGESHKEPTTEEEEEGEPITPAFLLGCASLSRKGWVTLSDGDQGRFGVRLPDPDQRVSVSAGCCSCSGPASIRVANFSQPFCTLVCYSLAMFYLCN